MNLNDIKDVTLKIEHGAWVKDLPNLPGVRVKVRGTFNADYNRLLTQLRGDLPQEEFLSESMQDKIQGQLLHETILLDWQGIEDAPYCSETAQQLLNDPDYAVFRRAVAYAGNVVATQGKQSLEADAKN